MHTYEFRPWAAQPTPHNDVDSYLAELIRREHPNIECLLDPHGSGEQEVLRTLLTELEPQDRVGVARAKVNRGLWHYGRRDPGRQQLVLFGPPDVEPALTQPVGESDRLVLSGAVGYDFFRNLRGADRKGIRRTLGGTGLRHMMRFGALVAVGCSGARFSTEPNAIQFSGEENEGLVQVTSIGSDMNGDVVISQRLDPVGVVRSPMGEDLPAYPQLPTSSIRVYYSSTISLFMRTLQHCLARADNVEDIRRMVTMAFSEYDESVNATATPEGRNLFANYGDSDGKVEAAILQGWVSSGNVVPDGRVIGSVLSNPYANDTADIVSCTNTLELRSNRSGGGRVMIPNTSMSDFLAAILRNTTRYGRSSIGSYANVARVLLAD